MVQTRKSVKHIKTFESYEPSGQCYSFAFKMAMSNIDNDKFKVVHGKVKDKWNQDKPSIEHAWVIKDGMYYDWQNSSGESQFHGNFSNGMTEDQFFTLYVIDGDVKEYSAMETISNCTKQKHHGPW